jgi:plasmid stabilization system protein ParE
MREIAWTLPAQADLRRIDSWLTQNRTAEHALRTVLAIRARAGFLEHFPHGGRPDRDGIRILRVQATPYLILYRLVFDRVEVLRVRHEREDWLVRP